MLDELLPLVYTELRRLCYLLFKSGLCSHWLSLRRPGSSELFLV